MVVGVLTTSYPRRAGDFAGCFVADDVRRRARAGATVEVIAAGDGAAGATTVREEDVTVTRIGTGAWPRGRSLFYGDGAPEVLERGGASAWLQAAAFWTALCREAGERTRSGRWDAIVSHWLLPCGLAAMAAAPRVRHRAYAHSGDVALLERLRGGRTLAGFIASSGAELVFVSEDLRHRFGAIVAGTPAPGEVQPLRPDPALFARPSRDDRGAARRRLGIAGPAVIAVGRLVPIKGFELLVEACAPDPATPLATELGPELVILGEGPERPALERLARRRGVRLRLPGLVAREQVPTWLAAADVYAQPSRTLSSGRSEGLPMAALEALAVGLPVVAARSGGLAELAELGSGVSLFPDGDVASLRAALAACLRARAAPPIAA